MSATPGDHGRAAVQVRFVDVDGVPTRCFMAGKEGAYPILLLHGITLNAEIWLRNIDALACDFRVVAPDMLGHGYTGPVAIDRGPILARKLAHLRRLVDRLGFDRFCASGSSYGALVAILLYFDLPTRVDKLIINGSGSSFNTDAQLTAVMKSTYDDLNDAIGGASAAFWRARLQKSFFDPGRFPDELLPSLMTCFARSWAVEAWRKSILDLLDLESLRPFRVLDRLEAIAAPSLVVWGREDRGAIYESAVEAVRRMPKARLETFEQCGHFPMIEHSGRYNVLVRDFVAGAS
ncbi:MAG: alpha/beta hydrolase [Alphaproteobacteria bacterium]